jgi:hypothetical protein
MIHSARRLVEGVALDTEALVDVLTLHKGEKGTAAVALDRLRRDMVSLGFLCYCGEPS